MTLNSTEIAAFRNQLEARAQVLRNELRETVQRSDADKAELLRDDVRDDGDDSFLDLIADVNLADVDRDLGEFRAVSAALTRIETGDYGFCEDCGQEISKQRLSAQPFAERCVECQERYEHLMTEGRAPSL